MKFESGRDVSHNRVNRLTCRKVSPSVRGIWSFTSAITWRAQRAAVRVQSTPTPRLTETVLVGRRDLDQGYVDRHLAGVNRLFDFAEEDRGVVGAALLDGFAHVAAEEQSVVAEVAFVLGAHIGRSPEREHVHDFNVVQFWGPFQEGVDQRLRGGAAFVNPDAVAGADGRQGFIRGSQLFAVLLSPTHGGSLF